MAHPFKERAAASVAAVFARLGADARVTPGVGLTVDCKVMPSTLDVDAPIDSFVARLRQTANGFDIQVADVATRPVKGDTIALLDDAGAPVETFTIVEDAVSEDRFRLVWKCRVGDPQ